jgi:hypothetical protein
LACMCLLRQSLGWNGCGVKQTVQGLDDNLATKVFFRPSKLLQ